MRPRRDGRRKSCVRFSRLVGWSPPPLLIAFGIAAIVMGVNGHSTVQNSLKQEKIVGSPDMTPAAIKAEAKKAGLNVAAARASPTLAGSPGRGGSTAWDQARAFAGYMRIHALGGHRWPDLRGRWAASWRSPEAPAQFTDGHVEPRLLGLGLDRGRVMSGEPTIFSCLRLFWTVDGR